jgi:hypothetical protein
MIEPFEDLTRLLSLLHTGAWDELPGAIVRFSAQAAPADPGELDEYRRRLHESLLVARAARASLAADLTRMQAALCFSSPYQYGTDVLEQHPATASQTFVS